MFEDVLKGMFREKPPLKKRVVSVWATKTKRPDGTTVFRVGRTGKRKRGGK